MILSSASLLNIARDSAAVKVAHDVHDVKIRGGVHDLTNWITHLRNVRARELALQQCQDDERISVRTLGLKTELQLKPSRRDDDAVVKSSHARGEQEDCFLREISFLVRSLYVDCFTYFFSLSLQSFTAMNEGISMCPFPPLFHLPTPPFTLKKINGSLSTTIMPLALQRGRAQKGKIRLQPSKSPSKLSGSCRPPRTRHGC